jgi:hypothetical protein
MLPQLRTLADSGRLTELWADEDAWHSLDIDYHPPHVERLYTDIGGLRVMLHRVHPCALDRALWHSHPWPCAVQILNGTYEHAIGFAQRGTLHTAAKTVMGPGSAYEMTDPLAWHYVRPLDEPVCSVMVCGKPWAKHTAPRPDEPLRPLTDEQVEDMRLTFGDLLAWREQ